MKEKLKESLIRTNFGYRLHLRRNGFVRPKNKPNFHHYNSVLQTYNEWESVLNEVEALKLPLHHYPQKNWDSLIALSLILQETNTKGKILDAGGEIYSVILPWLFLYGYTNLRCINLVFSELLKLGPIIYEYGDITQTKFDDETFDAITCLSVIEHGVNLDSYFKEMSRILKQGGLLITSADYWDKGIDTRGKVAFGVPIHVFSSSEILSALELANHYGLEAVSDIDLDCQEKAVSWKEHDLDYTFLILSLRKR